MWKNQHFQVSNFKHMLKRQGDKHPGFISCKLQIFFCFLLFPFLSSHAEGQFFKEVWGREPRPFRRWMRCSHVSRICKWQGDTQTSEMLGLNLRKRARSRWCITAPPFKHLMHGAVTKYIANRKQGRSVVPFLGHFASIWKNMLSGFTTWNLSLKVGAYILSSTELNNGKRFKTW